MMKTFKTFENFDKNEGLRIETSHYKAIQF